MDQNKATITSEEMETYQQVAALPYVAYEMSERRHEKREKWYSRVIVFLITLLVLCNMIWLYVFQSYDFLSETQYSGVYNLVDSQGNVISSDITPEDINRIMEVLANGNRQKD